MRINMTIDLDIDEGLYIKIDAKGKVSIKSEEPGEEAKYAPPKAPSTWAEAKQEILAERKPTAKIKTTRTRRGAQPSAEHMAIREMMLEKREPFALSEFIPLHSGSYNTARAFMYSVVSKLVDEGKVRMREKNKPLGVRRGAIEALYEVIP